MNKNCVFQYGTSRKMYEDTELITEEEAEALWGKYIPKFKQQVIDGDDPEMAIWVNMDESYSFKEASKHYWHGDFKEIDGV